MLKPSPTLVKRIYDLYEDIIDACAEDPYLEKTALKLRIEECFVRCSRNTNWRENFMQDIAGHWDATINEMDLEYCSDLAPRRQYLEANILDPFSIIREELFLRGFKDLSFKVEAARIDLSNLINETLNTARRVGQEQQEWSGEIIGDCLQALRIKGDAYKELWDTLMSAVDKHAEMWDVE